MIGGIDIQIPTLAGTLSVEVAVRAIREDWPRSVFENALTAERYNRFEDIPFRDIEELFVYRDAKVADRWDEHGAVPELFNSMVHIIHDQQVLTLVVDDRDALVDQLVSSVESALLDEVFRLAGTPEAA